MATLGAVLTSADGELAAGEDRLAEGGEVAGGDPGASKSLFSSSASVVALDGEAVAVGVPAKFGVGRACNRLNAGDAGTGLRGRRDHLRGAVFTVAGAGGIEAEGERDGRCEADCLTAEIVEGSDEEAGAAEEQRR